MARTRVAVIGSGHLARRIGMLAAERGFEVDHLSRNDFPADEEVESAFEALGRMLRGLDLASLATVFVVDDSDEKNLEVLIALLSVQQSLSIVASLFNEQLAPHLRAAHPKVQILNPARLAAPAFIAALDVPLTHTLRYLPASIVEDEPVAKRDDFMRALLLGFVALIVSAIAYFRLAEHLPWIDAVYFVIVSVTTVGYGDISLLHSSVTSKLVGIALLLGSTGFIWMIFSLTIDRIIKRRVQLALGRKRYSLREHVILCGLGRLGYFVAEGLLARKERVMIVESDEDSPAVQYFRSRGADVYIGDARLPRVLADVGVRRAKALYSVIDDDFANLQVGLNARSFAPDLRLILRIFDASMSHRIKQQLDIHLTLSMSAIADEHFVNALESSTPEPTAQSMPG
ncbi:MAG: NAD-binding protein [Gemmatimonadaceae bacterium]